MEGYRVKTPVQLRRVRYEQTNQPLRDFYDRLLYVADSTKMRSGNWQLCHVTSRYIPLPSAQLLAWTWIVGDRAYIVAINYGPHKASAHIALPKDIHTSDTASYQSIFCSTNYRPNDVQLKNNHLHTNLPAWAFTILQLQ
jgi:hypothetical protein